MLSLSGIVAIQAENGNPIKVQVVTLAGCPFCKDAMEVLSRLKSKYNLDIEDIDTKSEKGKELIEEYGITRAPTFFINGNYEPNLSGNEASLTARFEELSGE